jgi:hypothetical protein
MDFFLAKFVLRVLHELVSNWKFFIIPFHSPFPQFSVAVINLYNMLSYLIPIAAACHTRNVFCATSFSPICFQVCGQQRVLETRECVCVFFLNRSNLCVSYCIL